VFLHVATPAHARIVFTRSAWSHNHRRSLLLQMKSWLGQWWRSSHGSG